MVSVNLILEWKANGESQPELFKRLELPCLPPIGTVVWLADSAAPDGMEWNDAVAVESYVWYEKHPCLFDVYLSVWDMGECEDVAWQRDGLLDLGWQCGQQRFAR